MNRLLSRMPTGAALVLLAGLCAGSVHAAEAVAEVPRTPQGMACPHGIVEVVAQSSDAFDFRGEHYSRKSLKKALLAAHKVARFDCVLISGGEPKPAEVMDLVKSLARRNITHVEWTGTRAVPALPTKE